MLLAEGQEVSFQTWWTLSPWRTNGSAPWVDVADVPFHSLHTRPPRAHTLFSVFCSLNPHRTKYHSSYSYSFNFFCYISRNFSLSFSLPLSPPLSLSLSLSFSVFNLQGLSCRFLGLVRSETAVIKLIQWAFKAASGWEAQAPWPLSSMLQLQLAPSLSVLIRQGNLRKVCKCLNIHALFYMAFLS